MKRIFNHWYVILWGVVLTAIVVIALIQVFQGKQLTL